MTNCISCGMPMKTPSEFAMNEGKVLENSLIRVGIETPEQLRSAGAGDAFIRIRIHVDSGACLHMLCGIRGAIEGNRVPWPLF